MNLSMRALPIFKEDYCRNSISSLYLFNGVDSFCDLYNHNLYNSSKMSWDSWYYSSKMSWDSWYYMCSDDDADKVYISNNQMMMRW